MDRRVTLKDIGIDKLQLGNKIIRLYGDDKWVGRGGTCLVYNGYIQDTDVDGNKLENRIVLKEFYPLLSDNELVSIKRDSDGRVIIPEVSINSMEYSKKKRRFEESNDRFKYFHSQKETNNYVVKSLEMIEANGTLYIIMDYDNAEGMDKFILSKPSIYNFFVVLKKAAEAINSFHKLGYIHLDVTPSNLLYFDTHTYVSVMDTDSIVKKSDVDKCILSFSSGYSAPEVLERDTWVLKDCGEKADIFSIGALAYRFLMDEILDYMTDDNKIDKGRVEELLYNYAYEREIENKIHKKYSQCSRYAIDLIKSFLISTLSYNVDDRYKDMDEVIKAIENIEKYVKEIEWGIRENFVSNQGKVFGREEKIKELEERIKEQGERKVGRSRIVCISGIGGIGKSTLSRAYAEKHIEEYISIVEVHASSAREAILNIELLNENIVDSDRGNNIINKIENIEDYYEVKKKILKNIITDEKTDGKVLVIVHDYNVSKDDSFGVWNELGCDIILTSWNDWSKSGIKSIELKSSDLGKGDKHNAAVEIFKYYYMQVALHSRELLWIERIERLVSDEIECIKELVEVVGYHPLCIKLLAKQMAYINGMETKPSEMLCEIKEKGITRHLSEEVQNQKDSCAMEYGDAYYHLELIFGLEKNTGRLTDDEKEVLRLMTLIPPETGISISRFVEWTGLGEKGGIVLQKLCNKGWIEYEVSKSDVLYIDEDANNSRGVFFLPMVTLEVIYRQEDMGSNMYNSVEFINKCNKIDIENRTSYIKRNQAKSQLLHVIKYIGNDISNDYAVLLEKASIVLQDTAINYEEMEVCIKYKEEVLRIRKKLCDDVQNADIAKAYNNLGISYGDVGRTQDEIDCLVKALDIRKNILDNDSVDLAISYENVGICYEELGDIEESIKHKEIALEIYIKKYGEDDIHVAKIYNSLGVSYENRGYKKKAQKFLEKALEIRIKELGDRDIETAESYNSVGISCLRRGEIETAQKYLKKALEIRKEILGKNNLETALSYSNVGDSYINCGNYKEGIENKKEAVEIYKKFYGEEHKIVANNYYELSKIYAYKDERGSSKNYMEKTYNIRKKLFGEKSEKIKETKLELERISNNLVQIGTDEYYKIPIYIKTDVIDGKQAYFIDFINPFVGETNILRNTDKRDKFYSGSVTTMITSGLIFGYPNMSVEELGVNNSLEARVATQFAIWRIAKATEEAKKTELIFDMRNIKFVKELENAGERIIKAATNIINKSKKTPYCVEFISDINTKSIQLHIDNDSRKLLLGPIGFKFSGFNVEEIKIEMSNKPDSVIICDKDKNEKNLFVNEDEIYILMDFGDIGESFVLSCSGIGYHYYCKRYSTKVEDNIEDSIILDTYNDNLTKKIEINVMQDFKVGGKVVVNNKDQYDKELKGIVVEIRDVFNTIKETKVGDDNGIINFNDLKPGRYILTVLNKIEGYTMLDIPTEISVFLNDKTIVDLRHRKIEGFIKIKAMDEDFEKFIEGVEFQVLDDKKRIIDIITTDINGVALSKRLPYGKYYFKEVEGPRNIILDSTMREFNIKVDNGTSVYEVQHYYERGKLILELRNNIGKSNVTFEILNQEKKVVQKITTNNNGIATSKFLKHGRYFYKKEGEKEKKVEFIMEYKDKRIEIWE